VRINKYPGSCDEVSAVNINSRKVFIANFHPGNRCTLIDEEKWSWEDSRTSFSGR